MSLDPSTIGRRGLLVAGGLCLAGCATRPLETTAADWHEVPLPGKKPTRYRWERQGGREVLAAHAEHSASMWRRRLQVAPERLGEVSFSWRVDELVPGASVAHADREDASARVLFGFGGDLARLSGRNRMMFELAQALTGETPPYATLMYVWESEAPLDSVIVNPRTDRIRKIVLDSGPSNLGTWRHHRRSLVSDFRRVFGENPGPLQSIALMTDSDNTRSVARAWYGPVQVH